MFRLSILLILLVSCSSLGDEIRPPSKKLLVPSGQYGNVLRFADGHLMLRIDDLRLYDLNEQHFINIPLKDDPLCRKTDYAPSYPLPDGRLGIYMRCFGRWPDKPIGLDGAAYILAYDLDTDEISHLLDTYLPTHTNDFSWHPDMSRGVQSIGSYIMNTIQWLTPTGTEPIRVRIGEGEKTWSLDDYFTISQDDEARLEMGIARSPSWSPDGKYIAFWGSTAAMGRDGLARAGVPYHLYLLDPETMQWTTIVNQVQNTALANGLKWSPNSQYLLFTGQIGSKEGLWIVSIVDGTLNFIDDEDSGPFNGLNWLTNQDIVVTKCINEDCPETDVIQYDLSELIE